MRVWRVSKLIPTALGVSLILAGISTASHATQEPSFAWNIPTPFPRPAVPADNPMTTAKVELGRRLFYDPRLSANGSQSCSSCHRQALAFSDSDPRAIGSTGEEHPRGSMSLANVAYSPSLTWANPNDLSLEDQALVPMFGTQPVELGMAGLEHRLESDIRSDTMYVRLFARAFPQSDSAVTVRNIVRAIASFERTLLSLRSPYDRYRYGGDTNAISDAAKRGEKIFASGQRGSCFQCHGGWNFSGDVAFEGRAKRTAAFFNTGLYNLPGPLSYPSPNTGLHAFTKRTEDIGKFRAPTLRNIAVTGPYMHDGSLRTLSDVIDHYAAGGRIISSGPMAGVGRDNPNKAPNIRGFTITSEEKADLIAFLESLTDSTFLRDPALSNPWPRPPKR